MMPDDFPAVPADFDGPVVFEVRPEWRSGRGRWRRSNCALYTSDPQDAGVYPSARGVAGSELSYAVDVRVLARALREEGGRCLAVADILDTRAGLPIFQRDDRLGLPGDDLWLQYRVALLVACPAPDCCAPVGFLCRSPIGGFHDSRWRDGLRLVMRTGERDS